EYEEGKYVIFDDEDFEKLKTKKDKNITIEQFVNLKEVDPLYFDKPYYVSPTGAERAFSVLISAMEEEGKAGIAKTVLGTKETLILIRAKDGEMLLNTLFFNEEVTKNPTKEIKCEANSKEKEIAKQIIESMTAPFEPEKYKDEYRERVQRAIEEKIAGKEIIRPKETNQKNIVNLMEALQKSLEEVKEKKKKRNGIGENVSKSKDTTKNKTESGTKKSKISKTEKSKNSKTKTINEKG
ncbi:MAG: Ku protein, partial [Christensenellales bacterium]